MLYYFRIFISYLLYEFGVRRKDIIIFSGYKNLKYNFNSRYLFEFFLEKKSNLKCFFVIDDDNLRRRLNEIVGDYFVTTNSWKDLKLIFSAGTWITSGGLPIRIPYVNRNRVVVNLWHGLPFKGIGLLNNENTCLQNLLIYWVYSKYDLFSSTSELFQQIFARSFSINSKSIKILGQPWNDQLWNENDKYEVLGDIYGDNLPPFYKVFLFAPTWRSGRCTSFFPFKDFSKNRLESFLEKYQLLICLRTHQLEANRVKDYVSCKRVLLLNEDRVTDIMSILNIFDGLISDYSGIIFDYLLLDRPIILLPYDKEEYTSERSVNFNIDSFEFDPPPYNIDSFFSLLQKAVCCKCISQKQLRFKNVVHYYIDNNSCQRHYEEIMKLIKMKNNKQVKKWI